ncbi:MAG: thiamine pyrophosphate-dependent enzyme, partial [Alphaproteobacteria bacterium]
LKQRVVTVMGDGGLWHNGLSSGVIPAVFNNNDGVLVIMDNGYTSATGAQYVPSSGKHEGTDSQVIPIQAALKGIGVKWMRTNRTYNVDQMVKTFREAMTTPQKGLKVIIATGECMLAVQRRLRPLNREKLEAGERVLRTRFGVDDDVCTGDHSCIRLSGCPTLTIKPNPDPFRDHPVAHVDNGCVGCGVCGDVAHAAVLCPSFYRAEIVHNPSAGELWRDRMRRRYIAFLQGFGRHKVGAV